MFDCNGTIPNKKNATHCLLLVVTGSSGSVAAVQQEFSDLELCEIALNSFKSDNKILVSGGCFLKKQFVKN